MVGLYLQPKLGATNGWSGGWMLTYVTVTDTLNDSLVSTRRSVNYDQMAVDSDHRSMDTDQRTVNNDRKAVNYDQMALQYNL